MDFQVRKDEYLIAINDILQYLVKSMTHMQVTIGIRRTIMKNETSLKFQLTISDISFSKQS